MILLLKVLVAVLAMACFVSFGWAMKKFFVAPAAMSSGMKLLSTAGLVFFIAQLVRLGTSAHEHVGWLGVGAVMYAAALWLFWSAVRAARGASLGIAFSGKAPQALVLTGPYRWVRHPFYSTYALFWTAGVIAAHDLFLVPTAAIMIAVYLRALREEESILLEGPTAAAYRDYRRRTGALIPWLGRER